MHTPQLLFRLVTRFAMVLSFVSSAMAQCVVDSETGFDLKVIVTTPRAGLYDAPGDTQPSRMLSEMQIRFVLCPEETDPGADPSEVSESLDMDGERWYRVSFDAEEEEGWVKASDVTEWRTRSALQPKSLPGREFVVHPDDATQQALAYEGNPPEDYTLLAPILFPRDSLDDPYKVVVFQAKHAGTLSETGTKAAGKEPKGFPEATMEIVFVVDTTASMTELLEGVKTIVQQTADELGHRESEGKVLNDRVRFGLVAYQDATPGLTPADVKCELTDAESFNAEVADLTVAGLSSIEWEEDVIAGLVMAIDRKQDKDFGESVGWSFNSSKHIVLCGDASPILATAPKSSTKKSLDDVLDLAIYTSAEQTDAARLDVCLHAIMAKNPEGEGDWDTCRRAFLTLSERRGVEPVGVYQEVNPNDSSDRDRIVQKFCGDNNAYFAQMLNVLDTGDAPDDVLQSNPFAYGAYRLRDGTLFDGIMFGSANINDDDDRRVAIETWFIRFPELQRLASRLNSIGTEMDFLSSSQRKSSQHLLDAFAVSFATAGVGEPVATSELSVLAKGLPLRNDLLRMTIDDIARMDDGEFENWKKRLDACQRRCEDLLNLQPGGGGVNAWIQLGGNSTDPASTVSTKESVIFIPIDQLP